VAHLLKQLGFEDVRILKGGLGGWADAGFPLESKPAAVGGPA
jgi:3-mercaptopyruvate sulfurtransferase SseA